MPYCNVSFRQLHFGLEEIVQKVLGMMLLIVGTSAFVLGASTPEIGAGSAGSAVALLSGALLVIRGRRKK